MILELLMKIETFNKEEEAMKKVILFVLALAMMLTFFSCQKGDNYDYDKYKNNYIDYELPEISKEGITWPDNQTLPIFAPLAENLDAIDITAKSASVRATLSAFAGLINKKQPRVFLYTSGLKTEKWPEIVGFDYTLTKKQDEIILKYKSEIKGVVIWDTECKATLNLATVIASQKDALVIDGKQAETYTAGEFSFPVIEDLRDKFDNRLDVYNYLYDNYWKDCTKRLVVSIKEDGWELRDIAIAVNAVTFWLETKGEEKKLLEKFLADCEPGKSVCLGWWDSEGDGVTVSADYGMPTIPADYYYNYTVYSGAQCELDIPEIPAKPALENKIYFSFTFSDGDNLQYVQHAMKEAGQLWPNSKRGEVPINWTCSPALLDAGPAILNYFYQTSTPNDLLICGPSGLGYTYPLIWEKDTAGRDKLIEYMKRTDSYFRRSAFSIITVWNHISEPHQSLYAQNIRSLTGITAQEILPNQDSQRIIDGILPFTATHPRYDGDLPRVERILREVVDNWDGKEPLFVMPQVVAWETGFGVPGMVSIAKKFEKDYGDKVEFVRGDHLMMLMAEKNNTPYNISLGAESVTASGSDENHEAAKVVDGSFAKNKGWQCSDAEDKWITIDLKDTHTISRYIVKNAASGYYAKELNTANFKIEASSDGENWTLIDAVKDNTSNIVDKDVDSFDARYVRLYITKAGSDNVARIQEFELYGIKKK